MKVVLSQTLHYSYRYSHTYTHVYCSFKVWMLLYAFTKLFCHKLEVVQDHF